MGEAAGIYLICVTVVYSVMCGIAASNPAAPLWLRWPGPVWDVIAHGWQKPAQGPARPDYARIAQLERELGIVESALPEPSPFEQGMRRGMTGCLTKGCVGGDHETRTWSGYLIRRQHHCE
ncbi:hypothetical protein [Streptomyces sp. NPDC048252]|uniref:hypothetical protein n=1 Tax=Streptomyces sp. NPDC048252 TaxID=3154612 RepID=UPI00342BCF99